jgi:hypothetical protein
MAALARRHRAAVIAVIVLALGLAFALEHAAPTYQDSATVAFTAPKGANLFSNESGLLVIDALTADSVMSETGQRQVRAAGGTANYKVALVNLNTEDYPNYSDPYVTVTTTSHDPAAAAGTFSAVMDVMQSNLAGIQAKEGADPASFIQASTIAAPTGPVDQTGSQKRVMGATLVLAVILAFMLSRLLDRHPVPVRRLLRRFQGSAHQPRGQAAA